MAGTKPKRGARRRNSKTSNPRVQAEQIEDVRSDGYARFPDFTEVDSLEGYSDAATVLADKVNAFLMTCGDYNLVEEEMFKTLLIECINPKQLDNHLSSEFAQGLLAGHLLATEEFLSLQEQLEHEEN
jgi:hypothetical protein